MLKRCRRCHYSNEDSAHYCSQCGTPLELEEGQSTMSWRYYCVVPEIEYYGMQNEIKNLKRRLEELQGGKVN